MHAISQLRTPLLTLKSDKKNIPKKLKKKQKYRILHTKGERQSIKFYEHKVTIPNCTCMLNAYLSRQLKWKKKIPNET